VQRSFISSSPSSFIDDCQLVQPTPPGRIITPEIGHEVMATDLAEALRGLRLDESDVNIDDILFEQRPRKKIKQNSAELKSQLEKSYLSPSTSFSPEWLNKLQQCVLHIVLQLVLCFANRCQTLGVSG
jgi:hypothetical protein